jgi:predicted RNA-binding protein with PUA-like domain
MNYWLIKSEPNVFSIKDFQTEKQTIWDGVRNYQARNFLQQMKLEDQAFFYHSNIKDPAIVGIGRIIATNSIDLTQFDPDSQYYDPKSTQQNPRWRTVKLEFVTEFTHSITLTILKQKFTVEELILVKKGNRLSVMPILHHVAARILELAREI